MAELINLRQARKNRARADKEKTAEQNRARFGRTKAEKHEERNRRDMLDRHLDGHQRDGSEESES